MTARGLTVHPPGREEEELSFLRLANVLLRKTGNNVQFTTSDLEIQIRTTADMDGDAGSFTTTLACDPARVR